MLIFRNRFGESGRRDQFDKEVPVEERKGALAMRAKKKPKATKQGWSDKIKFRIQQKMPLMKKGPNPKTSIRLSIKEQNLYRYERKPNLMEGGKKGLDEKEKGYAPEIVSPCG